MGPNDMLRRQNLDRLRGSQYNDQKVPSQLTNLGLNRLNNNSWTDREDNQEEQPAEQAEIPNQPTEENTNQQNDSF